MEAWGQDSRNRPGAILIIGSGDDRGREFSDIVDVVFDGGEAFESNTNRTK